MDANRREQKNLIHSLAVAARQEVGTEVSKVSKRKGDLWQETFLRSLLTSVQNSLFFLACIRAFPDISITKVQETDLRKICNFCPNEITRAWLVRPQ